MTDDELIASLLREKIHWLQGTLLGAALPPDAVERMEEQLAHLRRVLPRYEGDQ